MDARRSCRHEQPQRRGRSRGANDKERADMGKITGFMELERVAGGVRAVAGAREALPRVHPARSPTTRPAMQGARCMDCGIPFCKSGCPVNNIIPDWNDLVYRQHWQRRARGAALDQQLPRVHRPRLPRAVRGGVHAQHQRRSGRHQVDRARHHRQGLGRRLGRAAAAGAQDRQEGRGRRLRARPGSPARSSSRAPATTSRCSRRTTASAACCATASPTSRWRSA